MFYFRRYINDILRPFLKPMDQKTALKYHFGAIFCYILVASNLVIYSFNKKNKLLNDDDLYVEKDDVLFKAKKKIEFYGIETQKIVQVGLGGIRTEDFDSKKYLAEKERIKEEKLDKEKLEVCI